MNERGKRMAAAAGLTLAIAFAALGALMLCDCPQFFAAAAVFSLIPVACGRTPVRLTAVIVLVTAASAAIIRLRHPNASARKSAQASMPAR